MGLIDNAVIHKEIDLIQACISRMAHNSFLIKGWTISIVAVVLALAEKLALSIDLYLIILIPLFGFWYLDSFFLQTEKKYREMYKWVLEKRELGDMEKKYDLNPNRFNDKVESRWQVMWSVTLRWFYGIPTTLVILFACFQVVRPYICTPQPLDAEQSDQGVSVVIENNTICIGGTCFKQCIYFLLKSNDLSRSK